MKTLERYNSKRNFSKTKEPRGTVSPSAEALRFCVQHHLARGDHYDLRLEWKGRALSWAIPKGPSYDSADKRLAMRVEDHPVSYMDFEGTIPKGEYGGGTVMLWDEGEWVPRLSPDEGLKAGSLKFELRGKRLKGNWALVRMRESEKEAWLFLKEKDGLQKDTPAISRYTRGVRSGRTMSEIEAADSKIPFSFPGVMLARLSQTLPEGKGWVYELKYDGFRALGFAEGGKAKLFSRNGQKLSGFAKAEKALEELLGGRAAAVDGEMIVVREDGLSDFGALQRYAKAGKGEGLHYVLFDLLALDGEDLRGLPLLERKEKLKALLAGAKPPLAYSEHVERMTKRELSALEKTGAEGIVCKRADSPYRAGRSDDWQKIKFRAGGEFAIGGFVRSETGELKALLAGVREGEELRYAGKIGTGFSKADKKELAAALLPLRRKTSPFCEKTPSNADAVWVEPLLVAEAEYAEITASGKLRQASFRGLRPDKSPAEITQTELPAREPKKYKKVEPKEKGDQAVRFCGVAVSHPERVVYPGRGITKGEVAAYYAAVAERMLPYLKGRALSLVVCPSGAEGERFFRRRLQDPPAGVKPLGEGFGVTGKRGILSLAQFNALEFHIPAAREGEKPDLMVFDFDPDEGLPLSVLREGVRKLKALLDDASLPSFLKTSGGKGYHVAVPFFARADAEKFAAFAKKAATLLEGEYPRLFTSSLSKRARAGKIFLDWQRNTPKSTSVCPYSLRARAGAPVSAPIFWEELGEISPNGIDLPRALSRLRERDPWQDLFKLRSRRFPS